MIKQKNSGGSCWNGKASEREISILTGIDESEVSACIKKLEKDKIIQL